VVSRRIAWIGVTGRARSSCSELLEAAIFSLRGAFSV
jgi:hypothetical protein